MHQYLQFPTWIQAEIIPGLPFRWYGLMYLLAFGTAYILFRIQLRKKKLSFDIDDVNTFFFWAIVGLLLGARVLYAFVYEPTGRYLSSPWLVFWPFDESWNFVGLAGMSYHGGLIGAIVAGIIYLRVKGYSCLQWGDLLTVSVPLAYTWGRLGNFINAELYGRVTTAPFGMIFPNAARFPANERWVVETAEEVGIPVVDADQMVNLPRHPSQLYEAFLEGILLWIVLWFIVDPRKRLQGAMIGWYVIGYGIARFIAEYFREPDPQLGFVLDLSATESAPHLLATPWSFTMGHVFSSVMILGGLLYLLILRWWAAGQPKVSTFATDTGPKRGGGKKKRAKR